MNPTIVNDPQYTNAIRAGLASIPTMSIILPIADLFDPNTGIYTHPLDHSNDGGDDEWERGCSMELIFPDGSPPAQTDCGLQIQGGSQRDPAKNAKHSFRVTFSSDYGPGKFKFPMFADSPVTSFNTLVLDSGINLLVALRRRQRAGRSALPRAMRPRPVHQRPDAGDGQPFLSRTILSIYISTVFIGECITSTNGRTMISPPVISAATTRIMT